MCYPEEIVRYVPVSTHSTHCVQREYPRWVRRCTERVMVCVCVSMSLCVSTAGVCVYEYREYCGGVRMSTVSTVAPRRYYSPNYSQTLLEKLDGYQIPA